MHGCEAHPRNLVALLVTEEPWHGCSVPMINDTRGPERSGGPKFFSKKKDPRPVRAEGPGGCPLVLVVGVLGVGKLCLFFELAVLLHGCADFADIVNEVFKLVHVYAIPEKVEVCEPRHY